MKRNFSGFIEGLAPSVEMSFIHTIWTILFAIVENAKANSESKQNRLPRNNDKIPISMKGRNHYV